MYEKIGGKKKNAQTQTVPFSETENAMILQKKLFLTPHPEIGLFSLISGHFLEAFFFFLEDKNPSRTLQSQDNVHQLPGEVNFVQHVRWGGL